MGYETNRNLYSVWKSSKGGLEDTSRPIQDHFYFEGTQPAQPAASSDVVDVEDGNRPGWTFQLQTEAGADSRTMISGRTRMQLMGTGAR